MKHMTTKTKKGPRKLAAAIRDAKEDEPFCLAYEGFYTDGTDTFKAYLGGLERTVDQQRALKEVLAPYLRKMNFTDGLLQSYIVSELDSDRVIIDPRYRSGRPFLESSGMPVFAILDELQGTIQVEQIAADFEISKQAVLDVRKHRRQLAPVA